MKANTSTIPYGYKLEDGRLVVDEISAENVKFFFGKQCEYAENPPAELVEAVIEEYQCSRGEKLSYEEAKLHVTNDAKRQYLSEELNIKNRVFKEGADHSIETLKAVLETPLTELKEQDSVHEVAQPDNSEKPDLKDLELFLQDTVNIIQILPSMDFINPLAEEQEQQPQEEKFRDFMNLFGINKDVAQRLLSKIDTFDLSLEWKKRVIEILKEYEN